MVEKIDTKDAVVFIALLPPIQSAIPFDGMGDGARIKLDIPREYNSEILRLQGLAGQSFKVVIIPDAP